VVDVASLIRMLVFIAIDILGNISIGSDSFTRFNRALYGLYLCPHRLI